MNGTSGPGLVIQPRDLTLLHELYHLRVTDREDARAIANFGSVTRVNTRLLQLYKGGMLARKAIGTTRGGHKFLYALSQRGARRIGKPFRAPMWNAHTDFAWSPTLEHQVTLNRVYLALKHPPDSVEAHLERWATFSTPISLTSRLIPDAYAELLTPTGALPVFVEVDLGTESLRIIHRKITAYIQLAVTGDFARIFQQTRFRVAILTPSLRRLETIRRVVARETNKLFWFCVFATNPRRTFWERSWLRPSDAEIKTFL